MIDWTQVSRVLLVRLRSIGDTVLMTPCLTALKQFRPDLQVAVLLEKLSAPLLKGHPQIDELILLDRAFSQWNDGMKRLRLVRRLRQAKFDVVFNMHGGTTATFLCYLSRAPHRIGYRGYPYSFLLKHRAPDPEVIWQKPQIHSVEQQVGLLKWTGIPIQEIPATSLYTSDAAQGNAARRLARAGIRGPFAVIHPAATSEDKRWPTPKFAQVVKYVASRYGLPSVMIGAGHEAHLLDNLKGFAGRSAYPFTNLHLKEVMALCSQARLFIGNDSGPAHIAMAMRCPTVVIFGASDHRVWRPWGDTPHAVVRVETDLSGRRLEPSERISYVPVGDVVDAIDRLLIETDEPSAVERAES
ncbi:MAG: glycosyltransferase family 9 protein [Acidobacteria bacterium]|nr:glycosyltransferase family 9 protein [Acidobacteriota bacterium]